MLHPQRAPAHRIGNGRPAAAPQSGEVYSILINLSGRRRFTSQRVVLYATLALQGREGAMAISTEALEIFCAAHAALIDGNDQVPGVFCEELERVYFGPGGADEVIRDFIGLARRGLDAISADRRGAPALVEQLVEMATPLLAVLNRVTQVYEDLGKREVASAKKQMTRVMQDIEAIAKQARIVSFNAQVIAARAGTVGREFAVVSGELTQITGKLDELVREALRSSAA
ncbi:MAG TPA: methyl-accepting chemotaxis protein [Methylibium sp.]|nr:methyl-accepting chemotaxis protein [Methylibium sp.]